MSTLPKDLRFFKNQFRHLNYYTLPTSILFVLRKRLNFILLFITLIFFVINTVM